MKKGFTLAEVLVTLAVIGVVAALAIPALMQNTNDAQYKTAWKKTYSDLSQATRKLALDNAGSLKTYFSDGNVMTNEYAAHLNTAKTCTGETAYGNCWHSSAVKSLSGPDLASSWFPKNGVILSNGSLLSFELQSSDCNSPNGTLNRCGNITVDVNGFKGPNTVGKDVYKLHVLENNTLPYGTQGDAYASNQSQRGCDLSLYPSAEGWTCAAEYLYK